MARAGCGRGVDPGSDTLVETAVRQSAEMSLGALALSSCGGARRKSYGGVMGPNDRAQSIVRRLTPTTGTDTKARMSSALCGSTLDAMALVGLFVMLAGLCHPFHTAMVALKVRRRCPFRPTIDKNSPRGSGVPAGDFVCRPAFLRGDSGQCPCFGDENTRREGPDISGL